MVLIYIANTALLMFNVIYYREFTDFMTIITIFVYSTVSQGLSGRSFALLKPQDNIIVADIIIVALVFITWFLHLDKRPIPRMQALALTSFSLFCLVLNITLNEISRPQIFSRT